MCVTLPYHAEGPFSARHRYQAPQTPVEHPCTSITVSPVPMSERLSVELYIHRPHTMSDSTHHKRSLHPLPQQECEWLRVEDRLCRSSPAYFHTHREPVKDAVRNTLHPVRQTH